MTNELLRDDPELLRIAAACLEYWKGEPYGPHRAICYSWVARLYASKFGGSFHQTRLAQLERLGILVKDGDTSRGGSRRYYRITDPRRLSEILKSHSLELQPELRNQ